MRGWLSSVVKLPDYFDIFVSNGFDDLSIIQEIQNENDLIELGIEKKGHRLKLMREIQKLRIENNQREGGESIMFAS